MFICASKCIILASKSLLVKIGKNKNIGFPNFIIFCETFARTELGFQFIFQALQMENLYRCSNLVLLSRVVCLMCR